MHSNMKFIMQVLITAAICFVLQSFLPWWSMAVGTAAVAYFIDNKGGASFLAGLVGVALLWLAVAFYIDASSQAILTSKVNKLLPIPALALTAIVGGLVGGLSALSGALLKSTFSFQK
jgi:hypothetical protein